MPVKQETLSSEDDAVRLDDSDAASALSVAARDGSRAELVLSGAGERVTGVLTGVAGDGVTFQSDEPRARIAPRGDCEMIVHQPDHPLRFATAVRRVDDRTGAVLLDRPTAVYTRQRRRFWRAELRGSTDVQLRLPNGSKATGRLLNISTHGLACRIDAAIGSVLRTGDRIPIVFSLDGAASDRFELEAEVRAKTASSDPAQEILRVRFVEEALDGATRERLNEAVCAGARGS
jgi:c-di-GMP-binding flagellar brake protein YcgR